MYFIELLILKKCKKIDPNLLDKYIHDTAIATLSGIIRNSTIKELAKVLRLPIVVLIRVLSKI